MKRTWIYAAGAVLALALGLIGWNRQKESDVQKGIAEKIIRFHVIANSDSSEDQELKLKVKEEVVATIEPLLKDADSVDQVREILQDSLPVIETTAADTLAANGCSTSVEAGLTHCYFPVKTYGEYTFPDGEYEALRIVIGAGEGKNWWCVMYPRLCFVDSLYSVVPEESKKELKAQLTDEEYDEILKGKKEIRIKSRLLELLGF